MVVGEDVTVFADDHPGSSPLGPVVFRRLRHLLEKSLKELPKGPVWYLRSVKGNIFNFGYLDIDHRRTQFFCQFGKGTRHDRW